MLKFLLGLCIVGFTTFCGYLLSKKYRKRKLFFKEWREFNERFLTEISYSRRPLKGFISAYAYQGEFDELLREYSSKLEEGGVPKKEGYPFLREEEGRMIEDYFSMLGRGNAASQAGYFSSVKGKLSTLAEGAEKDSKRYGDLYIKFGFLCGLLILILIV